MVDKIKITNNKSGFTITEVLVSIVVISFLLITVGTVLATATNVNQKAERRTEAAELAFAKVQDYINLAYSAIPVGDDLTSYEVEDFSADLSDTRLTNPVAKVYVEPESSVAPVVVTSTTPFDETITADSTFAGGGEINVIDEDDATGVYWREWRISDNSFTNYTYNAYNGGNPNNLATPSIDLGSEQLVDTLRIEWWTCTYGADDFRVEAKNGNQFSNSGWTTIVSGLSDNNPTCSSSDSNPQDIDVSSNTTPYRHWRLYIVDATDNDFNVISELEAFRDGLPGDVAQQRGSDASSGAGDLYLDGSDDTLELSYDGSSIGHQSVGIIFDDLTIPQGVTVDSAHIEFTAAESDSNNVTLNVTGVDEDDAPDWAGGVPYLLDNSVDGDNSDGLVGTTATTAWTPGPWSSGEVGEDTQADVTTIVQEIVNRAGWAPGNNMAFVIQPDNLSDNDHRVAERTPAPQLVINWSVTSTTTEYPYVDGDGDGDADDPTLLRIRSVIQYSESGTTREVEYTTFVRQGGVSD